VLPSVRRRGIENFIHTALNTFYQSAITFTGQSIGASDPRRTVRVFRINLALTTGLGIVLCALAQIFQVPLLGLYVQSSDPAYDAVIAAGVVRVLALSRFQWVGGLMETACGTLRGLGHSMNPTVTTLIARVCCGWSGGTPCLKRWAPWRACTGPIRSAGS